MAELSHVGMGYTVCPHCGERSEVNCILLDMRLKKSLSRMNFMGFVLCDKHLELAKTADCVCMYAVDHMEDGFKLHGGGLLVPRALFHNITENRHPDIQPGMCCEIKPEMFDNLLQAATMAGRVTDSENLSFNEKTEAVAGHA